MPNCSPQAKFLATPLAESLTMVKQPFGLPLELGQRPYFANSRDIVKRDVATLHFFPRTS